MNAESEQQERRRGRPLDESRDEALRDAALALLAEVGYDRLTFDAVATHARAGKTTIYRRWSSKAEMIVDALGRAKGSLELPDTGSLAGDLRAMAYAITGPQNRFDARVTLGLITALGHDMELREVFRQRFVEPRLTAMGDLFERAVARGEIAPDQDLEFLAQLFPALALQHLVLNGEIPDAALADRIMTKVVLPLATAPHKGKALTDSTMSPVPRGPA